MTGDRFEAHLRDALNALHNALAALDAASIEAPNAAHRGSVEHFRGEVAQIICDGDSEAGLTTYISQEVSA